MVNYPFLEPLSAFYPNRYKGINKPFPNIYKIDVIALSKILLHLLLRRILDLLKVN